MTTQRYVITREDIYKLIEYSLRHHGKLVGTLGDGYDRLSVIQTAEDVKEGRYIVEITS